MARVNLSLFDAPPAMVAEVRAGHAKLAEQAAVLAGALADAPPPSEPAEAPYDPPAAPNPLPAFFADVADALANVSVVQPGPMVVVVPKPTPDELKAALTEYANNPPPLVVVPSVEIVAVTTQPLVAQLAGVAPPVDYHAHPALSASDIRRGYHTPEAALWSRLHPTEPTQAMINGSALHLAVLEPHRYTEEVAVKPEGMTFVSKEGKAWREQHAGRLIVSADIDARAKVYAAHSAGVLLQLGATAPHFEMPVLWTDPVAGDCRCKPDCYWLDADGIPHLASVKTTAKPIAATEWAATLASTPRGPGYDIGEYHYARGLAAVHLQDAERWSEVIIHHVVLSTEGPPQIAIWELGAAILHRASTIWTDKAPRIAAALTAPMPAVIVIGGTIADVPRWAAMPATEDETP